MFVLYRKIFIGGLSYGTDDGTTPFFFLSPFFAHPTPLNFLLLFLCRQIEAVFSGLWDGAGRGGDEGSRLAKVKRLRLHHLH